MRVVARHPSSHSSELALRAGTSIVNARGVPGTVACVARLRLDGRIVVLASHHVLFGATVRAREMVSLRLAPTAPWLVDVGHSLHGRFGAMEYEQLYYHVDCAVASVESAPYGVIASLASREKCEAIGWAVVGEAVFKRGAVTGATTGLVADIAYMDVVRLDGRATIAPRQLLIRSASPDRPFSAAGDSGALVRNARGDGIAMLSGITPRGDSVACHLLPVFHVLHLRL